MPVLKYKDPVTGNWVPIVSGPKGPPGPPGPSSVTNPNSLFGRSIIDYGADPTGVALSDAAFTAALTENAVVYVPIGTFRISQPVTLVSGKSLIGAKGPYDWETPNAVSKIIQTNLSQPIIQGTAVSGVRLENLNLSAVANHNVDGVYFVKGSHDASNYIDTVNVHVSDVGRDGFSVENLIVSTWIGAVASNCLRYGINLYGQEGGAAGTSVTLTSCFVNNCVTAGYRLRTMTYMSLISCAADACVGPSYDITQSSGISINGCGAEGAKTSVFKITDWVTGISLNGCWAYGTEAGAVYEIYGSRGVTLLGCSELASVAGVNSFSIDHDSTVTVMNPYYESTPVYGDSTIVIGDEVMQGSLFGGLVTLSYDPILPLHAVTKNYVDNKVQGGVKQTAVNGTASIVFNPEFTVPPTVVLTAMGTKGFLAAAAPPTLTGVNVVAWTDAGIALQTYFSWIAVPSVPT